MTAVAVASKDIQKNGLNFFIMILLTKVLNIFNELTIDCLFWSVQNVTILFFLLLGKV